MSVAAPRCGSGRRPVGTTRALHLAPSPRPLARDHDSWYPGPHTPSPARDAARPLSLALLSSINRSSTRVEGRRGREGLIRDWVGPADSAAVRSGGDLLCSVLSGTLFLRRTHPNASSGRRWPGRRPNCARPSRCSLVVLPNAGRRWRRLSEPSCMVRPRPVTVALASVTSARGALGASPTSRAVASDDAMEVGSSAHRERAPLRARLPRASARERCVP